MSNYDFIKFLFISIRILFNNKKKWWRVRGRKHEELVFASFKRRRKDQDPWLEAPWIQSVNRGTEKDERSGIDAIVETDVGPIYLQIKSSEQYAQIFRDHQLTGRYSPSIALVIINDDDGKLTPEDVRQIVATAVMPKYRKELALHLDKYNKSDNRLFNFLQKLPQ